MYSTKQEHKAYLAGCYARVLAPLLNERRSMQSYMVPATTDHTVLKVHLNTLQQALKLRMEAREKNRTQLNILADCVQNALEYYRYYEGVSAPVTVAVRKQPGRTKLSAKPKPRIQPVQYIPDDVVDTFVRPYVYTPELVDRYMQQYITKREFATQLMAHKNYKAAIKYCGELIRDECEKNSSSPEYTKWAVDFHRVKYGTHLALQIQTHLTCYIFTHWPDIDSMLQVPEVTPDIIDAILADMLKAMVMSPNRTIDDILFCILDYMQPRHVAFRVLLRKLLTDRCDTTRFSDQLLHLIFQHTRQVYTAEHNQTQLQFHDALIYDDICRVCAGETVTIKTNCLITNKTQWYFEHISEEEVAGRLAGLGEESEVELAFRQSPAYVHLSLFLAVMTEDLTKLAQTVVSVPVPDGTVEDEPPALVPI